MILIHRALWLLLWLRLRGWLRAQFNVGNPKRLAFAVVGSCIFALWLLSVLAGQLLGAHRPRATPFQPEAARAVVSVLFAFFAYLAILTGTATRALAFRPSELDFVLPAPFSRATLINFKLLWILLSSLFSGVIFSFFLVRHTNNLPAAFAGGVLGVAFTSLFAIVVTLLLELSGPRRAALLWGVRVVVLAIAAFTAWRVVSLVGTTSIPTQRLTLLAEALSHPLTVALLTPFAPFARAVTTPAPLESLAWLGVSAMMVALAWLAIIRLDKVWLDVAVRASDEHAQQLERRHLAPRSRLAATLAARTPPLRWLGPSRALARRHVGPNLHLLVAIPLAAALLPLLTLASPAGGAVPTFAMLALAGAIALVVLPSTLRLDFRGDLDHFETFKALPLTPRQIVVGELFTPFLLVMLTLGAVLIAALAIAPPEARRMLLACLPALFVGLPSLALLQLCIGNTLFLHFPARPPASPTMNAAASGRVTMIAIARIMLTIAALVPAALAAWGAHALTDGYWPVVALVGASVLAGAAGVGVRSTIAAWERFDVSQDMPA